MLEIKGSRGLHGEMSFDFIKQVNEINQKEAVILCQKYYANKGISLINVSENSDWFQKGADLIEETPEKQILIDVKCDEIIAKTGNVVVELIEISSYNGFVKKGWAYSGILRDTQESKDS